MHDSLKQRFVMWCRNLCIFHYWGKWQKPVFVEDQRISFQFRECLRCGKVQHRFVSRIRHQDIEVKHQNIEITCYQPDSNDIKTKPPTDK